MSSADRPSLLRKRQRWLAGPAAAFATSPPTRVSAGSGTGRVGRPPVGADNLSHGATQARQANRPKPPGHRLLVARARNDGSSFHRPGDGREDRPTMTNINLQENSGSRRSAFESAAAASALQF